MRQINFVIIFVICLALVLFGIENTEPAVIRIVEGVQLQAPLSIELILAMGVGAVLAWVFSVWTQLQRMADTNRQVRDKDTVIQKLEEDVERYKAEIQEQQRLLPAAQSIAQDAEATEVYAQ
ncbi:LapA family protein [Leptolyngbya sp. FACHB-36]|uniref:lipopolysaccharide assembly protein LapA domain-containing protein n=1 Tax=Leptolyngbya sp. FACHB-36 TaxID=2692808 RepID=UPI00167FEA5C|nr:LapA family protein [Leptolyngbya sp. FACHB-36]MBD2019684.1 LapA family protein [Leptolyngbya sp. FACHB-36]